MTIARVVNRIAAGLGHVCALPDVPQEMSLQRWHEASCQRVDDYLDRVRAEDGPIWPTARWRGRSVGGGYEVAHTTATGRLAITAREAVPGRVPLLIEAVAGPAGPRPATVVATAQWSDLESGQESGQLRVSSYQLVAEKPDRLGDLALVIRRSGLPVDAAGQALLHAVEARERAYCALLAAAALAGQGGGNTEGS